MNFISTIPALTAMFFCLSQGRDSLEHLNGVEYDEYIVYNEELLDKEGNRAASFFVEDFSLEKFVEEGLGDRDDVEKDSEPVMIMYKREGGNTLLCWDDVWYAGTLHYGEDGYVYVKLPKDTERKEYTVPSVYQAAQFFFCKMSVIRAWKRLPVDLHSEVWIGLRSRCA